MLRTRSNSRHLHLSLFDHGIHLNGLDYGEAIGSFDAVVRGLEQRRTTAQEIGMRVHNTLCPLVLSVVSVKHQGV